MDITTLGRVNVVLQRVFIVVLALYFCIGLVYILLYLSDIEIFFHPAILVRLENFYGIDIPLQLH
jgi:hypothetical protein